MEVSFETDEDEEAGPGSRRESQPVGGTIVEKLNIRQVEAFRVVMTYGSMKKAAEVLDISQPAVSRLITSLTEAVGFTLFTRQQGGVMPTDDAIAFMRDVERVFAGTDELRRSADAIRRKEAGVVRIAAMAHYANDLLPELLGRFSLRHPRIRVMLETRSRIEIGDSVRMGLSDLGVTSLPIPTGGTQVHTLACEPAVVILPQDHALAGREKLVPEDFQGERFISFGAGTPFRAEIDAIFDGRGVRREMVIEASAPESIVRLVGVGAGAAIVSPFTIDISTTKGVVALPFEPQVTVEVGLLTDDRSLSTAAVAMIDFLREQFASGAATGRYALSAK